MAEVSRTNRYINPAILPEASKTWADIRIGVKSSPFAGMWLDVFGGYKYTEEDLLFNPSSYPFINNGFNNVSTAYSANTQRISAGATVKYDFCTMLDFYLKGVYHHYNVTNEGVKDIPAYGLPSIIVNCGVNYRPVNPLTLNLDYCLMSGMTASVSGQDIDMKAINDLRLRATWKCNDMFGIYAQFNNLLFQNHQLYYGYPLQPFTAMAGLNINF